MHIYIYIYIYARDGDKGTTPPKHNFPGSSTRRIVLRASCVCPGVSILGAMQLDPTPSNDV